MNLCFLVNLSGFGGLEIQTILRAKDAIKLGFNSIVATKKNTRASNFCKQLNLEHREISNFFFYKATQLKKIFKRFNVDICIVPKTNLLPVAVLTKKLNNNYPKVIFYQQMQSGIRKRDIYHNWIYKNLDGTIVLTKIMKQMLTETTRINPEKVFVVPYGVDWENFQKEKKNKILNRKNLKIPQDAFVVGCIGRIEPLKGQETLVEAFSMAKIENSLLVLVGNKDNELYFNKLIELGKKLDLGDRIKFINFNFEISKIMSTFDVFVMPSLSETFGLVLIEAMACSLPTIATRSGGVPEIIEEYKDGLLYEPKQSEQLCKLLETLYNNPNYASELGNNAFEKVKIKFDYHQNVYKFFEVCKLIHSS